MSRIASVGFLVVVCVGCGHAPTTPPTPPKETVLTTSTSAPDSTSSTASSTTPPPISTSQPPSTTVVEREQPHEDHPAPTAKPTVSGAVDWADPTSVATGWVLAANTWEPSDTPADMAARADKFLAGEAAKENRGSVVFGTDTAMGVPQTLSITRAASLDPTGTNDDRTEIRVEADVLDTQSAGTPIAIAAWNLTLTKEGDKWLIVAIERSSR